MPQTLRWPRGVGLCGLVSCRQTGRLVTRHSVWVCAYLVRSKVTPKVACVGIVRVRISPRSYKRTCRGQQEPPTWVRGRAVPKAHFSCHSLTTESPNHQAGAGNGPRGPQPTYPPPGCGRVDTPRPDQLPKPGSYLVHGVPERPWWTQAPSGLLTALLLAPSPLRELVPPAHHLYRCGQLG